MHVGSNLAQASVLEWYHILQNHNNVLYSYVCINTYVQYTFDLVTQLYMYISYNYYYAHVQLFWYHIKFELYSYCSYTCSKILLHILDWLFLVQLLYQPLHIYRNVVKIGHSLMLDAYCVHVSTKMKLMAIHMHV